MRVLYKAIAQFGASRRNLEHTLLVKADQFCCATDTVLSFDWSQKGTSCLQSLLLTRTISLYCKWAGTIYFSSTQDTLQLDATEERLLQREVFLRLATLYTDTSSRSLVRDRHVFFTCYQTCYLTIRTLHQCEASPLHVETHYRYLMLSRTFTVSL